MPRGDLVAVALQGDFGKPRSALILQSDWFEEHPTVTLLPVTSTLLDAPLLRVTLEPSTRNGLQKTSQVMVDQVMTVRREKMGPLLGRVEPERMLEIERCLAIFLGVAK